MAAAVLPEISASDRGLGRARADKHAAARGFGSHKSGQVDRTVDPDGVVIRDWKVASGGCTDCAMHGRSISLAEPQEASGLFPIPFRNRQIRGEIFEPRGSPAASPR